MFVVMVVAAKSELVWVGGVGVAVHLRHEEIETGKDQTVVGYPAESLKRISFAPPRQQNQHQGQRNDLAQLNSDIE